ncbi:MAG: GlsB/YeaQ/YmgE family stress response membrane protein [Streptosporangiaceae bacterium]
MVMYIIVLLIIGLIAGAVARLLVPGRDPIGFFGTILLGVVGSFVGGFIWNLIEYHRIAPHKFHTVGIIGSILGAILVLILMRLTHTERGHRRRFRRRRFGRI